MTTTTGRTKPKGDTDPAGHSSSGSVLIRDLSLPPVCLQNEMWLTSDCFADPAIPGQGTTPRCYPQGRGHPQLAPLGSEP